MKKLYVYLFVIAALAITTGCHHNCKDPCYRTHPSNGDIVVGKPKVTVSAEKSTLFGPMQQFKDRNLLQEALSKNKADMKALREAHYGKKSRGILEQQGNYNYVIDENGIYRRPPSDGGNIRVSAENVAIAIGENAHATATSEVTINGKEYEQ